jgi:hypothetical protein
VAAYSQINRYQISAYGTQANNGCYIVDSKRRLIGVLGAKYDRHGPLFGPSCVDLYECRRRVARGGWRSNALEKSLHY